jgi:hypothetical protein
METMVHRKVLGFQSSDALDLGEALQARTCVTHPWHVLLL